MDNIYITDDEKNKFINFLHYIFENEVDFTHTIVLNKMYHKIHNILFDTLPNMPQIMLYHICYYIDDELIIGIEATMKNTSLIDNCTIEFNIFGDIMLNYKSISFVYSFFYLLYNSPIGGILEPGAGPRLYNSEIMYYLHPIVNNTIEYKCKKKNKLIPRDSDTLNDEVYFMNYFMKRYYNKDNYINWNLKYNNSDYKYHTKQNRITIIRDVDYDNKPITTIRKIQNKYQLKNIIMIHKIILDILVEQIDYYINVTTTFTRYTDTMVNTLGLNNIIDRLYNGNNSNA